MKPIFEYIKEGLDFVVVDTDAYKGVVVVSFLHKHYACQYRYSDVSEAEKKIEEAKDSIVVKIVDNLLQGFQMAADTVIEETEEEISP